MIDRRMFFPSGLERYISNKWNVDIDIRRLSKLGHRPRLRKLHKYRTWLWRCASPASWCSCCSCLSRFQELRREGDVPHGHICAVENWSGLWCLYPFSDRLYLDQVDAVRAVIQFQQFWVWKSYIIPCLLQTAQSIRLFQIVEVIWVERCSVTSYVVDMLLGPKFQASAGCLVGLAWLVHWSKSQTQLCRWMAVFLWSLTRRRSHLGNCESGCQLDTIDVGPLSRTQLGRSETI